MNNFEIGFYSALCASVVGGFWGVVIALIDVQWGVCIGFSLFLFCYVILYNNAKYSDKELSDAEKRFNDL